MIATYLPLTLTQSFAHQAKIIEATKDQRYWAYFMEQGTGKTHVTLAVATHLFRQGKINGMLVLAPNGVHSNWALKEIPTHCPLVEDQERFTAIWQSNGPVRKRQRFRMGGQRLAA
jgi:type I site-specific restriction endonuclease